MNKWIGLFEVVPKPACDVLEGAIGAFVNVVALSDSAFKFEHMVRGVMGEHGLNVIDIEDVELVDERIKKGELSGELKALAASLTEEFPIQFDEFQAYEA